MKKFFNLFILGLTMIIPISAISRFVDNSEYSNNIIPTSESKNGGGSACETNSNFTLVSTANEFMSAAKSNKDICVVNDLDFSSIPSGDYKISSYSKEIDGNNYVLSNKVNSTTSIDYLFYTFTGYMHNIIFENFAFIINYLDGTNFNYPIQVENIVMRDATIQGINLTSSISSLQNPNYRLNNLYPISPFIGVAVGANVENVSLQNITFDSNSIVVYSSIRGQITRISYGNFVGMSSYSTFTSISIYNVVLSNNLFNVITTNGVNDDISASLNKGLYISLIIGVDYYSIYKDMSIFQATLVNNVFKSFNSVFGALIAYAEGTGFENGYFFKTNISNNKVYNRPSDQINYIGAYVGRTISSIGTILNITDFVFHSTTSSQNFYINYATDESTLLPRNEIFSANTTNNTVINYRVYFFNDSSILSRPEIGEGFGYGYLSLFNQLTNSFWLDGANGVDFSDGNWSTGLIDLNYMPSNLGYGLPLLGTQLFVNTRLDFSGETIKIIFESPLLNDNDLILNSIWGEQINVADLPNYTYDTGISVYDVFNSDQTLNYYMNSWYWIDANESIPLAVIEGDLTNQTELNPYVSPSRSINTSLSSSGINIYGNEIIDDSKVIISSSPNEMTILDADGNEHIIDLSSPNTLLTPDYVNENNVNSLYQIKSIPTFTYIDENKQLQTYTPTVSGMFTNISETPSIIPTTGTIQTTFDASTNDLTIQAFINDPQLLYSINDSSLENTYVKITSSFAEFTSDSNGDDFSIEIPMSSLLEGSYVLNLKPTLSESAIDNMYSIQVVSALKYYDDLNYGTSPVLFNELGALTNTTPYPPYDTSFDLAGYLDSSYNPVTNQITFKITPKEEDSLKYVTNLQIAIGIESTLSNDLIIFNSDSTEIKFQMDSLVQQYYYYTLENNIPFDINDFFALSLDTNYDNYVEYLDSDGTTKRIEIIGLVADDSLGLKDGYLKVSGDLINLDKSTIYQVPEVQEVKQTPLPKTYWAVLTLSLVVLSFVSSEFYQLVRKLF